MTWHPCSLRPHQVKPAALKGWLLDRGSLTERIIGVSHGAFRVEVLHQQWGIAEHDEALLLGIKPRQAALIREVILYGSNQPWVYARSVLPAKSLSRSLGHLKRLGTKPLGAVLFSDHHMQRSEIEISLLHPHQLPLLIDSPVWGRRSVFYLQHQPLLVSEVFLPAFIKQVC